MVLPGSSGISTVRVSRGVAVRKHEVPLFRASRSNICRVHSSRYDEGIGTERISDLTVVAVKSDLARDEPLQGVRASVR